MKFVTLSELEEIELREDVERVDILGISGIDNSSHWFVVYYTNGEDEDVYVDSSEFEG